ncbi:MAG: thioredoxin family protein [bacterium]|nr:thioredoxin family protein [bacterium]
MIIKLFTKPDCPKCPVAKILVDGLRLAVNDLRIEKYNVSTVEGLAEASFYSVLSTPGIILCDNNGKEIKGWRGETPSESELIRFLS